MLKKPALLDITVYNFFSLIPDLSDVGPMRVICNPGCHWATVQEQQQYEEEELQQQQQRQQQQQLLLLLAQQQQQRQVRSPGYLLRTRKAEESAGDPQRIQTRSEKYLFRVRKDSPAGAGQAQIRNRKGGYLFRYVVCTYVGIIVRTSWCSRRPTTQRHASSCLLGVRTYAVCELRYNRVCLCAH